VHTLELLHHEFYLESAAILSKTHLLLRSEQPEEIHLRHNELKYYPDQCFFEQSFQSSQVQHLPHYDLKCHYTA